MNSSVWRWLLIAVIHALDIASPWIVYEFLMHRAWSAGMWPIFGVATAACLYFSGDFVEGGLRIRVVKVAAFRTVAFLTASALTYSLGGPESTMALTGGCCLEGGSPWSLFTWTEANAWLFALPVIPVLRAFRQTLPEIMRSIRRPESSFPGTNAKI